MKSKQHRFEVVVLTFKNRESAKAALLCAMAARDPDGCFFTVKAKPPVKKGGAR